MSGEASIALFIFGLLILLALGGKNGKDKPTEKKVRAKEAEKYTKPYSAIYHSSVEPNSKSEGKICSTCGNVTFNDGYCSYCDNND